MLVCIHSCMHTYTTYRWAEDPVPLAPTRTPMALAPPSHTSHSAHVSRSTSTVTTPTSASTATTPSTSHRSASTLHHMPPTLAFPTTSDDMLLSNHPFAIYGMAWKQYEKRDLLADERTMSEPRDVRMRQQQRMVQSEIKPKLHQGTRGVHVSPSIQTWWRLGELVVLHYHVMQHVCTCHACM